MSLRFDGTMCIECGKKGDFPSLSCPECVKRWEEEAREWDEFWERHPELRDQMQ